MQPSTTKFPDGQQAHASAESKYTVRDRPENEAAIRIHVQLMSLEASTSTGDWDFAAVRRAMRVLCAYPPDVRDAQATARGLRLVWDILKRRGVHAEVYQVPGIMPLIVAGTGPLLIITYLDEQSPMSGSEQRTAPSVSGDVATGAGVTRRAGLLASIGPIASGALRADDVTVIIEADRHVGSLAFQAWLSATERKLTSALWEATDLPVRTPAVFRSSTGVVSLGVSLHTECSDIESLYAGVLPDTGHQLMELLAGLKSRDSEVLIPGFYDGIETPDTQGLDSLESISEIVHEWVARGLGQANGDPHLSPSHVTLGAFCAPSILVRSVEIPDSRPFVPRDARATIEARLMPGQDAHAIATEITDYLKRRMSTARIDPILVRQPYYGTWHGAADFGSGVSVYPTAPGDSPAGILGVHGVTSLGYATVAREPAKTDEEVRISSITEASDFILRLSRQANTVLGTQP
jgi:hypothetical protein